MNIENFDKTDLKNLIKEVLKEDKTFFKEIINEILMEEKLIAPKAKNENRTDRLMKMINEDFDKYDDVFKALA